jgi:rare lipoprotein A
VTNLANGRQVVVRVTDRGPWKSTRLIDLSKRAAIDLDMIRAGTARVAIQVVEAENDTEEPELPTTR